MAPADEIQAAEARLGLRLPPSYRRQLLATDGLPGDHGLMLLPVAQIDRFGQREPEWLAGWMEGYEMGAGMHNDVRLPDDPTDPATMPTDQLADTIVVSTSADERVLLLNPMVVDPAGEWEAWDFANWYPGAYRYTSFARLLEMLSRGP